MLLWLRLEERAVKLHVRALDLSDRLTRIGSQIDSSITKCQRPKKRVVARSIELLAAQANFE